MSLYPPSRSRYSRWDGTQDIPELNADEILASLTDDLMDYGDLEHALRNLMRRGAQMPQTGSMPGLNELMQRLRKQRREQLDRFDMGGVLDDITKQLEEILQLERDTIDNWQGGKIDHGDDHADGSAEPAGERGDDGDAHGAAAQKQFSDMLNSLVDEASRAADNAEGGSSPPREGDERSDGPFSDQLLEDIADRNRDYLDKLPEDPAGKVKSLQKYEFLNPDAQRKFLELLKQLREGMMNTFFKDMEKMVNDMSDGDIARMKDMVKALNDMLNKHIGGEDPGFDDFMKEFGDMFGPNPPQSIDELLEQMQQQMAAMQSLMSSMSPDQRAQLQSLLGDRLGDPELEHELTKLAKEMQFLLPEPSRYSFRGDQDLDLKSAMELMGEMHDLDDLEQQMQQALRNGQLDHIDLDKLEEMLGEEARQALEQMKNLLEILEEAGFVRRDGDDWELTARGMRKIGQSALGEIYAQLKKQSLGNHALPEEGRFGEQIEDSKAYEFGDPFHLDMSRTIRNALEREGPRTPVRLLPDDFEVYRSEIVSQTATVLCIDLSWSMALRGSFHAAKKVAMALQQLITTQYPRDKFFVVGFSAYARELKAHEVPYVQVDEYVLGTNIQHALQMAERLLARYQVGTKQILMITDGEPTSHLENGRAQFAHPPTPMTLNATYKAVKQCTRKNVTINTFMLDRSPYLKDFVDKMAKINGGRVFYSTPEHLGEYLLHDYVQHKRKRLGRR